MYYERAAYFLAGFCGFCIVCPTVYCFCRCMTRTKAERKAEMQRAASDMVKYDTAV